MKSRSILAALAVLAAFVAPRAQALDRISFATNWLADAEHGGFYQAVADGTYAACGLDVTIMQGGPQVGSELANEIDRERRKVVSDCDKQCREIIEQYRKVIEDLAVVLLAKDTILGPDFLKLFTESKAKHVDAAKSVQSAAESQDKPE